MFKVINKERREDIVTTSSADMAALEGNEAEDANNGIISKLTPHEVIQERKLGDQPITVRILYCLSKDAETWAASCTVVRARQACF